MTVASQIENTTAARRDGIHLPVRWIVPSINTASGAGANQTVASYGEPRELVKEVSRVCRAFQPTSRLHTFPQENPVYLFWQARSTGDWIVARITAALSADGSIGALDYYCLAFDQRTFHALRYNPFRTLSLNLHDRLRLHLQEGRTDPFRCTIPRSAAPKSMPLISDAREEGRNRAITGLSADRLPSDSNIRVIREFCSRWSDDPTPPPAFATWWGSDAAAAVATPACFDIVLHRREPIVSNIGGARRAVVKMAAELTEVSARACPIADLVAVDLVRLIQSNAALLKEAMARAAVSSGVEAPHRLQNDIAEATLLLGQIRTHLASLADHIKGRRSIEEIDALTRMSSQAEDLEYAIQDLAFVEAPVTASKRPAAWPFARQSTSQPAEAANTTATPKPEHEPWYAVLHLLAH